MSLELTLDHVGFVGSDMQAMSLTARKLGLSPTEPEVLLARDSGTRAATSLGQSSCHVVFESGYVELTSVFTADPNHHLAAWLRLGLGCHILALGTADVERMHGICTAAALAPTDIATATRPIGYGAKRGHAQFDWFMLPAVQFPPALLCVVRNRTPELVYQPQVQSHPLGARSLAAVSLVVDDPQALLQTPLAWLPRAAQRHAGEFTIQLLGGELRLLTRAAAARRWGEAFDGRRWAAGGIAALDIRVADLGVAERLLRQRHVAYRQSGAELQVASANANGSVLVLR